MNKLLLLVFVVLLLVWFSNAQSVGHRAADLKYAGIKYYSGELDSCPIIQKGTAHYFGTASGLEFSGNAYNNKTGCGYIFRPFQDMGVASWFYPCHVKLLVTNLANGKSVVATVMDRGPDRIKHPNVKIDLYKRVFDELGGTGGQMQVSVVPISGCVPSDAANVASAVSGLKSAVSQMEIDIPLSINFPFELKSPLQAGESVDVLGGKCLIPYAISAQNSDLICSVDCDMTWRSLSHPGQCYNK